MKHLFVKGHKHSKETKRKLAIQKIGEKNPMWKGGKWLDDGYYRLSQFNGRFEHRVVMENFIGRKLKRSEHVHHINFNKQDNRLENLMVVSNFEHKKLHRKFDKCSICSKPHRAKGLCAVHYNKQYGYGGYSVVL